MNDERISDVLALQLMITRLEVARASVSLTPLYSSAAKAARVAVLGNIDDAISELVGTIEQLYSTAQQDIEDEKAQEAISKRLDELRGH